MSQPPVFAKAGFSKQLRALYGRVRKLPVAGAGIGWLANALYPRGSRVWVRVQGGLDKGLWMRLDPRFEESYGTADYETGVQTFLAEHLRPGDTFYEVGAHIGFLSMGAARLVGTEGQVIAFEADPENAARIEEHLRRNGLAQARVVPFAVWSAAETLRFERAPLLSSRNMGSVLGGSAPRADSEVIEVEAIRLDDYVREHRPPSFIKIDVEGAELHVLQGAESCLLAQRPLVLCEVHGRQIAKEIEDWLPGKGYRLEWLSSEDRFPRHLVAWPQR